MELNNSEWEMQSEVRSATSWWHTPYCLRGWKNRLAPFHGRMS